MVNCMKSPNGGRGTAFIAGTSASHIFFVAQMDMLSDCSWQDETGLVVIPCIDRRVMVVYLGCRAFFFALSP